MGQEILRGNLADFGFALHYTTKISDSMEKFKVERKEFSSSVSGYFKFTNTGLSTYFIFYTFKLYDSNI